MAFFMPYNIHHPQRAQMPLEALLSLVDDLNTHPRRNRGGCSNTYRAAAAPRRPWQPRFDAQETPEGFVLRGELPGLNKDHVTIEFPEAQKIVISGKVVESNGEATSTHVEEAQQSTADDASSETESRSSHQATVEDADDDDDFEMLGHASEKSQEKQKQPEAAEKTETLEQPAPERVSRQFSRAFTFAVPVSHDFVTATLKDGLLTVEVPKAKHEPHHVVVN